MCVINKGPVVVYYVVVFLWVGAVINSQAFAGTSIIRIHLCPSVVNS